MSELCAVRSLQKGDLPLENQSKVVYDDSNDCMTGGSRITYRECSKWKPTAWAAWKQTTQAFFVPEKENDYGNVITGKRTEE